MTSAPRQQARITEYPDAPAPTSTPQDVQNFFIEIFLANSETLNQRQAEEMAKKMEVNGQGLYMLNEETFKEAFGHHGVILYNILRTGKYGLVCVSPKDFCDLNLLH